MRSSLTEETRQTLASALKEQGLALDKALVSLAGDKDTHSAQATSELEGRLQEMGERIETSLAERFEALESKIRADLESVDTKQAEDTASAIATLREEMAEMHRQLKDYQERLVKAEGQGLAAGSAKEKDKGIVPAQAAVASMEPLNDTDASLLQLALTKLQQHATRSDAKLNDVTTSVAKMNVKSMQVGQPIRHTLLPSPCFGH